MNKKKAFEVACLVMASLSSGMLIADGKLLLGLLGWMYLFVYIFNHGEGDL